MAGEPTRFGPPGNNPVLGRLATFLDLPKTERRFIYDLVVSTEPIGETPLCHDPDNNLRTKNGYNTFAARTSMALSHTSKTIRAEFRPLAMKEHRVAVALHEYETFLHTFVFTGLNLDHITIVTTKWPVDETNLRAMIVARSQEEGGNHLQSRILFEDKYMTNICAVSKSWEKLLSCGHVQSITFREDENGAILTFTISRELGELADAEGFSAIEHDVPEFSALRTPISVFKSAAWGNDQTRTAPKTWAQFFYENGEKFDDRAWCVYNGM